MDIRVIWVLGLVVTSGVEGCSIPRSLSLSPFSGRKTQSSLQCHLCLDRKDHFRHNYSFTLTRNGKVVKFSQITSRKIWYPLDSKKNNTGLWKCIVQEFQDLSAEYYLGPPTSAPPTENKKDTEEVSVPTSPMSTRTLVTIVTAILLLLIISVVISFTSGICIMKQCRNKSASRQHHKERQRSDNFPLTENISSELSNPRTEEDPEVSYVELEIIRDPSRKPSQSQNTIYANIM